MGKVILDMSMSLDGFIAGPEDQPERLHDWMFPAVGLVAAENQAIIDESIRTTGAIIMGRHMYNLGAVQNGFADNPCQVPHYVLTRNPPDQPAAGDTSFIFVSDGIESALAQAKAAAQERNVAIAGGAYTAQQAIHAGILDEIHLHLIPVFLGEGLRLLEPFHGNYIELESRQAVSASGVIHLQLTNEKGEKS